MNAVVSMGNCVYVCACVCYKSDQLGQSSLAWPLNCIDPGHANSSSSMDVRKFSGILVEALVEAPEIFSNSLVILWDFPSGFCFS